MLFHSRTSNGVAIQLVGCPWQRRWCASKPRLIECRENFHPTLAVVKARRRGHRIYLRVSPKEIPPITILLKSASQVGLNPHRPAGRIRTRATRPAGRWVDEYVTKRHVTLWWDICESYNVRWEKTLCNVGSNTCRHRKAQFLFSALETLIRIVLGAILAGLAVTCIAMCLLFVTYSSTQRPADLQSNFIACSELDLTLSELKLFKF